MIDHETLHVCYNNADYKSNMNGETNYGFIFWFDTKFEGFSTIVEILKLFSCSIKTSNMSGRNY